MQKNTSIENKMNMKDKIISVAYRDASVTDYILVYVKMIFNKDIRETYTEYRLTAKAVHSLPVEKYTGNDPAEESGSIVYKVKKPVYRIIYSRPAYSVVITAFIILLVSVFYLNRALMQPEYSEEQVRHAEQEVKYSLAVLGRTFNSTETVLKSDLTNKVAKPLNEGITVIDNLFRGGKNE